MSNKNYTDFFKAFGEFKTPNVDFNNIIAIHRRNLEAFSAANQVVTEGFQAYARRQAEIAQDNLEKSLAASKELFSAASPEVGVEKQTKFAKEMLQRSVDNLRELGELASKSNVEAIDLLSKRAVETIEELSKVSAAPAKKSSIIQSASVQKIA